MKDMERLEQLMQSLRQEDAGRGAPPFLETRLRAAFRNRHTQKPGLHRWKLVAGLAMALALAIAAWRTGTPARVEAPRPEIRAEVPKPNKPGIAAALPRFAGDRLADAPKPGPRSVKRPAPVEAAKEFSEPFIPLPYAPPLTSWDRGEVVRVRLPRQSLRTLGLPVDEDRLMERIPADILLGEDGVARGIRFVRANPEISPTL